MFGKKRITVCSVSRTGVTATLFVKTGKGLVVEKRIEVATFQALRTQFGIQRIRILLSEQDTYLKLFTFPEGTVLTRTLVKEKAKETISEIAVDGFMDWKKVRISDGGISVQVYVVKKETLAPILTVCEQAGITVEACEPPSFAMARMASKVHEPFLLVYPPVKPEYISVIMDGNVLDVMRVDPLGSLEDTKRSCIASVAKTWGISVRAIATNVPDPVLGLASKTETTEEDLDVLTLPTDRKEEEGMKRIPRPLGIAVIALLILVIGFLGSKLAGIGGKPSTKTPISSVVTEPTPTDVPLSRTNLKIEVQNGSGQAGLAGKGKKVFETLGYTTVTTANADTYDYTGVTVKGKTSAIAAFVITDIKETYKNASASSAVLDMASPVDAVVILGK